MRNLLALVAAVLVTAGIAGSYLGWYKVTSTPAANGHRNLSIDLNTAKVEQDVAKEAKTIEQAIDKKLNGNSTTPMQPAKTSSVGITDGNLQQTGYSSPVVPITPVMPNGRPYTQTSVPVTPVRPVAPGGGLVNPY